MRGTIALAGLGITGYEDPESLYVCSTCGLCQHFCPRSVKQIDIVRSIRGAVAGTGFVPGLFRNVSYSVRTFSNPWGMELSSHFLFEPGMSAPPFSEKSEYCLFICCSAGYEPRVRETVKALVRVLKSTGVSFGVLRGDLICCGESVRKTGAEAEYEFLARRNIEALQHSGAKKILAVSPHCYYTLKNEYPRYGGDFEVYHASEVLSGVVGKLRGSMQEPLRVTYHDPCYLGRHSEIYEPPRDVIRHLENVEYVELDRTRAMGICCGGGGGKIWLTVSKKERLADLRVEEAVKKDVDVVVTACPYCLMMLEYSAGLLEIENGHRPKVLDLSELVALRCPGD